MDRVIYWTAVIVFGLGILAVVPLVAIGLWDVIERVGGKIRGVYRQWRGLSHPQVTESFSSRYGDQL